MDASVGSIRVLAAQPSQGGRFTVRPHGATRRQQHQRSAEDQQTFMSGVRLIKPKRLESGDCGEHRPFSVFTRRPPRREFDTLPPYRLCRGFGLLARCDASARQVPERNARQDQWAKRGNAVSHPALSDSRM